MPRKSELLVVGDELLAKNEHGVAVHAGFDRGDLARAQRATAIDAGDLADKHRMQRPDRDGHYDAFAIGGAASIPRMSGRCSRPQKSSPSTIKLGTPKT